MQIIPVIDLMQGRVVRGVAGRRDEYRAVESVIAAEPTPACVANSLADHFRFDEIYVADLDAIAGSSPAFQSYQQIASAGLRLWIDAGVNTIARAQQIAGRADPEFEVANVIVGLESVDGPQTLAQVFAEIPNGCALFSLDLKDGVPLTSSEAWRGMDAEAIAEVAVATGFSRIIVLDLSHVGTEQGIGAGALCRQIKQRFPSIELISGGGIRGLDDLRALQEAGCDAALVASALHNGRLTRNDVDAVSRW